MSEIISLTGGPVVAPGLPPNTDLVEALEWLLDRAKNGQIVGAAVVPMEADGVCPYFLVGRVGGFTMAGAVSAVLHEVNRVNTSDA